MVIYVYLGIAFLKICHPIEPFFGDGGSGDWLQISGRPPLDEPIGCYTKRVQGTLLEPPAVRSAALPIGLQPILLTMAGLNPRGSEVWRYLAASRNRRRYPGFGPVSAESVVDGRLGLAFIFMASSLHLMRYVKNIRCLGKDCESMSP